MKDERELPIVPLPDGFVASEDYFKLLDDLVVGKPFWIDYVFVPGNMTTEDINMLPETGWAC